jgi:glycosyltransferase involved in cell wall biosynthesis
MGNHTIALVIEGTYPWYRGGVSKWVTRYIQFFSNFNFHIVQIAADHYLHNDFSEAIYEIPKQVQTFTRIQAPNCKTNWDISAKAWLQKWLNKTEEVSDYADIIHVANTGFAGLLGAMMAKKNAKPLILTEHGLYWKEIEMGAVALECGYKVSKDKKMKVQMVNYFKHIARLTYQLANEVISVSHCNISYQERLGARHVHYIPNGVDKIWLTKYKQKSEIPVIGWIGRCSEMKNPLQFFDVIEGFRRHEYTKARFIMMICNANEPDLWKQVNEKANNYPELTLVLNASANGYLDQMDALCITSHNESQPLVMFEALAKKVLPVGWQAGDVTSTYGIIEPPSTAVEILVKDIMKLWQCPQEWDKAVKKRFKMVEAKHTWDKIFEQYHKLFHPYLVALC